MAGATIGGLDLGRLKARLDLAGGVLEVADLRGRMVDRPEGGGLPAPTEPPPAEGPLPRGGFRGRVRAELTGERSLQVEMEGAELPIAELLNVEPSLVPPSAPPTLRGLPIAGRLNVRASARGRGSESWDPHSWTLSGHAQMPEVAYRSTRLKDVSSRLAIEKGRLVLPDLSGRIGDAAFKGRLGIELAEPWPYDGELETGDLSCQELLGLVPNAPKSIKVEGTIAGRGDARGALKPWRIASSGQAKVAGLKVERFSVGDVPIRWTTQGETIAISAEEHQRVRRPGLGRGPRAGRRGSSDRGDGHPVEG